jgi:hypothetical protein
VLFDDRGPLAQLGRLDGGALAGRATANAHEVDVVAHEGQVVDRNRDDAMTSLRRSDVARRG